MNQFWLAKHVYLCESDDHAVLLNLKNDRYVALGRKPSLALQHKVRGWPRSPAKSTDPPIDSEYAQGLTLVMLQAGLLTTDATLGKPATPVHLTAPTTPLVETALAHRLTPSVEPLHRIHLIDCWRFVLAYLICCARHKLRPIEDITSLIQARKERARPDATPNIELSRALVIKHRLLRNFFYGPKSRCLFDSHVLIEFMARYRLYPDWVFAISTCPFKAHCWVQQQHLILNDTPEHAGMYHPIMLI